MGELPPMKIYQLLLVALFFSLGSLMADDLSRFKGDWAVLYGNGATRYYSISSRGEVTWVESGRVKKATLEPSGRAYLLDFKDTKLDRFVADGRTFRVEHYHPGTNLQNGLAGVPGTPERTQFFKINKIKTK